MGFQMEMENVHAFMTVYHNSSLKTIMANNCKWRTHATRIYCNNWTYAAQQLDECTDNCDIYGACIDIHGYHGDDCKIAK